MGMKMSLNQMDMNVVMYPEITGEKQKQDHSQHNMDNDPNRYNANALGEIKT
jgi:hypothetical protein